MASKPSVTLTFAGDADKLTRAMSDVGGASERLGHQVGDASEKMRHAGVSAEGLAEHTDTAETRAQGFADVLTGVKDGLSAWGDESLSTQDKLIAMGQAGADLAGGMTSFVIPAVAALGSGLKTGLGGALNFIAAHPIVFALLAIAAILVLLWTHSETFRRIVTAAFGAAADFVMHTLGGAFDWVVGKITWFIDASRQAADKVIGFFRGVGDGIAGAFRGALNFVADAWNNGIGRFSLSIPSWVPVLGGHTFSMPNIPRFHGGGLVPGMPGTEVPIIAQAGERLTRAGAASSDVTVRFAGNLADGLAELIMELIRVGKIVIEV